ncbi:MAG TPA: DUF3106 domain-containing protein [Verrucomicrobiae bacterium]|nr:DUF3106 domain-containing protein [Verrucomicrobiae bacterium]
MKWFRQARWWLVLCAAGLLCVCSLNAADSTNAPVISSISTAHSPVDFFRKLLVMSPDERENYLTNRPPEIRERILAKVGEYEALDPDERELRLRATELRWYLMPLLHTSPTNRAARLARVPDDIRPLVQDRLDQWQILPPTLQQEFLENERILRYFTHVDTTNISTEDSWHEPSDAERSHWNSLSEGERRQITAGFNQFFELKPDEKQQALNTLSDSERAQMEKTLKAFDQLPPAQRTECVNAFAKFAGMNASEQAEFLKNAARWAQMSPKERQAWRDLVTHVPEWPPLPVGFMPPATNNRN